MKYTDSDVLKIFKDAVNTDFVEFLLPPAFVNTLKTFGKTDEQIITYFRNYHNVYTRGEFFTQIENVIVKNNIDLASKEAYGIWGYTTNFFYRDLNEWLRLGSNVDKTQEITNLLIAATAKVPKYTGTAYRALEFDQSKLPGFLQKFAKEGSDVKFDDFLSCGSTQEAAFFNKPSKNVRITMKVFDAPDISAYADGIKFRGYQPKELLLTPGKKFHVVQVVEKNGIYEIDMVQIQ